MFCFYFYFFQLYVYIYICNNLILYSNPSSFSHPLPYPKPNPHILLSENTFSNGESTKLITVLNLQDVIQGTTQLTTWFDSSIKYIFSNFSTFVRNIYAFLVQSNTNQTEVILFIQSLKSQFALFNHLHNVIKLMMILENCKINIQILPPLNCCMLSNISSLQKNKLVVLVCD